MPDPHPLVCRFGAFGDMILLTPLLKQLHLRSGLACDIVAVGSWNKLLFAEMPYVRKVYSVDSRSAPYWFNRSQRELVSQLKQQQHRFIWICETNDKSYRLLTRAQITRHNSANLLDLTARSNEHYTDKWLRLGQLSPPGFEFPQHIPAPTTELFVSIDEREQCKNWLKSRQLDPAAPIVCIQAGNKRTTRRGRANRDSNTKYWPVAHWAAVIDEIFAQLPEAQVLLCGLPAELDLCHAIQAQCRSGNSLHAVADELPLRRLLALLSLAHSCISVDTGPAHAAAALNCPLVVLFGKADPTRFRPISNQSPVKVLQGYASGDYLGEPDIAHISPQQVVRQWLALFEVPVMPTKRQATSTELESTIA